MEDAHHREGIDVIPDIPQETEASGGDSSNGAGDPFAETEPSTFGPDPVPEQDGPQEPTLDEQEENLRDTVFKTANALAEDAIKTKRATLSLINSIMRNAFAGQKDTTRAVPFLAALFSITGTRRGYDMRHGDRGRNPVDLPTGSLEPDAGPDPDQERAVQEARRLATIIGGETPDRLEEIIREMTFTTVEPSVLFRLATWDPTGTEDGYRLVHQVIPDIGSQVLMRSREIHLGPVRYIDGLPAADMPDVIPRQMYSLTTDGRKAPSVHLTLSDKRSIVAFLDNLTKRWTRVLGEGLATGGMPWSVNEFLEHVGIADDSLAISRHLGFSYTAMNGFVMVSNIANSGDAALCAVQVDELELIGVLLFLVQAAIEAGFTVTCVGYGDYTPILNAVCGYHTVDQVTASHAGEILGLCPGLTYTTNKPGPGQVTAGPETIILVDDAYVRLVEMTRSARFYMDLTEARTVGAVTRSLQRENASDDLYKVREGGLYLVDVSGIEQLMIGTIQLLHVSNAGTTLCLVFPIGCYNLSNGSSKQINGELTPVNCHYEPMPLVMLFAMLKQEDSYYVTGSGAILGRNPAMRRPDACQDSTQLTGGRITWDQRMFVQAPPMVTVHDLYNGPRLPTWLQPGPDGIIELDPHFEATLNLIDRMQNGVTVNRVYLAGPTHAQIQNCIIDPVKSESLVGPMKVLHSWLSALSHGTLPNFNFDFGPIGSQRERAGVLGLNFQSQIAMAFMGNRAILDNPVYQTLAAKYHWVRVPEGSGLAPCPPGVTTRLGPDTTVSLLVVSYLEDDRPDHGRRLVVVRTSMSTPPIPVAPDLVAVMLLEIGRLAASQSGDQYVATYAGTIDHTVILYPSHLVLEFMRETGCTDMSPEEFLNGDSLPSGETILTEHQERHQTAAAMARRARTRRLADARRKMANVHELAVSGSLHNKKGKDIAALVGQDNEREEFDPISAEDEKAADEFFGAMY